MSWTREEVFEGRQNGALIFVYMLAKLAYLREVSFFCMLHG
jgi:hypothetical protein